MKDILAYVMVVFALWSGIDYFIKNRAVFTNQEAEK
jgi:hypothetical protein